MECTYIISLCTQYLFDLLEWRRFSEKLPIERRLETLVRSTNSIMIHPEELRCIRLQLTQDGAVHQWRSHWFSLSSCGDVRPGLSPVCTKWGLTPTCHGRGVQQPEKSYLRGGGDVFFQTLAEKVHIFKFIAGKELSQRRGRCIINVLYAIVLACYIPGSTPIITFLHLIHFKYVIIIFLKKLF